MSLPEDKPKLMFVAFMMFVQNFGFFVQVPPHRQRVDVESASKNLCVVGLVWWSDERCRRG